MNEQLKRVLQSAAQLLRMLSKLTKEPTGTSKEAAQYVAEEIEEMLADSTTETD